jgi:hypothetical protein
MAKALMPKEYNENLTPNPAICGKPTYKTLHHMRETLQANTATIATLLSGSTNGYIGLV